jgi:hypothetical protein
MFNVKFATRAVTVALGKRDSVNSFIEPPYRGRSELPTTEIPRRRVLGRSRDKTGCSA